MACFADTNVSQGSVATYARCDVIFFDIHLTANLQKNLSVKKKFSNLLRIDKIMVISLWPRFLAHLVYTIRYEMYFNVRSKADGGNQKVIAVEFHPKR